MNMKRAPKYKCAKCHKLHTRAHTICASCSKPAHPAVIRAEADMVYAIRNASCFIASLFVGRGEYEKLGATTVLAAVDCARDLEARHVASTRRAIIYAVSTDNVATMITYELIERLTGAQV